MALPSFAKAERRLSRWGDKLGLEHTIAGETFPIRGRMAVMEVAKRFPVESEELWGQIERREVTTDAYLAGWKQLFKRMSKVVLFRDIRITFERHDS